MLIRCGPLLGGRLLESAAVPTRRGWSFAFSAAAHAALISGAVAATVVPKSARRDESVPFVALALAPAQVKPEPASASADARPKPKGFQELVAPREIPNTISVADLRPTTLSSDDFSGRGVLGGIADGVAPSTIETVGTGIGDAIDASLADQQPYLIPGQIGPRYPDELRDAAPDGIVIVRFIIDTLGRAETPSLHVMESSDPLFAQSVRVALERLRYAPARFGGRRIRVRVEQRFEFHLAAE